MMLTSSGEGGGGDEKYIYIWLYTDDCIGLVGILERVELLRSLHHVMQVHVCFCDCSHEDAGA